MVLAICLKIYQCDAKTIDLLAGFLDVQDVPHLDKLTFAVHHLWAVRCIERFWWQLSSKRGAAAKSRMLKRMRAYTQATSLELPGGDPEPYHAHVLFRDFNFLTYEGDVEPPPVIVVQQVFGAAGHRDLGGEGQVMVCTGRGEPPPPPPGFAQPLSY